VEHFRLVFKAGITGWEFSVRMYFRLENTEGKETWEVIGHVKEPIYFSTEDELPRGIRRVKRELNLQVRLPRCVV